VDTAHYLSTHTVTSHCRYHVVFCPKYRRKVWVPPIAERLKTILLEQTERWGQAMRELEVMPDHVHLLLGCDPQFGIHRLVQLWKGQSAPTLRAEVPALKRRLPSLWTKSYLVATVGGVTRAVLTRYVAGQKGRGDWGRSRPANTACILPRSRSASSTAR
jgi:putative transposase